MKSKLRFSIALLGLAGLLPCSAEVYTLPDFTRDADQATVDVAYDFVTNDGWSNMPPNAIAGEGSVYLKFTVSWEAAPDIGFFDVQFNVSDDGGAGRWSARTEDAGFAFFTSNSTGDPDGAGPATAKPSVEAVDKTAVTSATFVLKVDQIQAAINPGGDWWFADPAQQDAAAGFLYINPDLNASEAGQSTVWAAWRSGNTSYQGVSFQTDTAGVDLNFSDIAIYTGTDSPFVTTPGVVNAITSTVSASPAAVLADGVMTSTITVTLKDDGGIPVADKVVSLAGDTGNATIETANHISSESGVVTFTARSSTVEAEEFTATGNSVPITQTASVNFTPLVADAGISTVAALPVTALADNFSTTTITVTLKNSSGLPLPGKDVTLANTAGPQAATITAVSPTTNANGVATFTVKSATIGIEEFTATDVTDSNLVITQKASVEFLTPDAPALLVHEPFNYTANAGLAGNGGGMGFAAASIWADGPETNGVAGVFNSSTATTPRNLAAGNLSWDGVIDNLNTTGGFVALLNDAGDKWESYRPLAQDAGTLAGADKVLWASMAWHRVGGGFGQHVGLALATDCFTDRGKKLSTGGGFGSNTGDGIGVAESTINSGRYSAAVFDAGIASAITTSGSLPGGDFVLVLKFEFGAVDTVSAYAFPESAVLSEADFNANKITASAAVDESTLNMLTFSNVRGEPAFDEIRLGNTFADVTPAVGSTSPYSTWAATNAPSPQTSEDDFDGDGVSNAVEFVLGGDKDTNDLDKLPTVSEDVTHMTFSFERDQDSIDASTLVMIEVSADLAIWDTAPSPYTVPDTATAGPPVAVVDNTDGSDTVTLTVAKAPDTKKFARLKVVITP